MRVYLVLFLAIGILCSSNYNLENEKTSNNILTGNLNFDTSKPFDINDFSCSQLRNPEKVLPIKNLKLELSIEFDDIIHFKITDRENERYVPPMDVLMNNRYDYDLSKFKPKKNFENFGIKISKAPFSFELYNTTTQKTYYTFSNSTFLFSDKFIVFESFLTSNDIYGFGERSHDFKLGDGIFTIWPNDTGGVVEDDGQGGQNLMGHQPIGLHRTESGEFLGFVFINTNMQDVVIKTKSEGNVSLQHKTIGGIIDYYIIVGSSPESVIKRIHYLLGPPTLPPYWGLGFHQCRYGFKDAKHFKSVYDNYKKFKIPIDAMWTDIDTLDDFAIFTLDKENFKNLPSYVHDFQKEGVHFVPIIDLGVSYKKKNKFISIGEKLNCFIKSNYTKEILIGKVWPGDTIFPDFLNPNTTILWHYGLNEYEKLVHFDGFWIDMNEPAMLDKKDKCIGEVGNFCPKENNHYYYDDLPYLPGYLPGRKTDMATRSISENALLYGKSELLSAAYNTKPLISILMGKETWSYLYRTGKRPFIVSRSTTIGNGKYTFHWLGDNFSSYSSLKIDINGVFSFNIFGIPMTGDDICGFFGEANDNLCARWFNLGAFYPMSRSHNTIDSTDQFPWSLGSKTLSAARNAITHRYSLLRYMYTELFLTTLNEKIGLFKPVFFEYPEDPESYNQIGEKAMFGSRFILIPVLKESDSNFGMTFPEDNWNTFPEGKVFLTKGDKREDVVVSGSYDKINIFLRGGSIVPYQDTFSKYIRCSEELRKNPVQLMINPQEGAAEGVIIYDNDDLSAIKYKKYIKVALKFENNSVTFKVYNGLRGTQYKYGDINVSKIILMRYSTLGTNNSSASVVFANGSKKDLSVSVKKDIDVGEVALSASILDLSKISFN